MHGIGHSKRVSLLAKFLAQGTQADTTVTGLFAFLHDVKRENDEYDLLHGKRAAEYVVQALYAEGLLHITATQLEQVSYACEHHSDRYAQSDDITIQTCWDADRLDLWRVGIEPNPALLYTHKAKQTQTIQYALRLWQG